MRMTAPDMLLVQARTVLDQLEHQARAATPGPWTGHEDAGPYGFEIWSPINWVASAAQPADAAFVAAWSPSFVLAVVGMLRATVDGWEQVLRDHHRVDVWLPHRPDACAVCDFERETYPCTVRTAALDGLERLATIGFPEQSAVAAGDLQ